MDGWMNMVLAFGVALLCSIAPFVVAVVRRQIALGVVVAATILLGAFAGWWMALIAGVVCLGVVIITPSLERERIEDDIDVQSERRRPSRLPGWIRHRAFRWPVLALMIVAVLIGVWVESTQLRLLIFGKRTGLPSEMTQREMDDVVKKLHEIYKARMLAVNLQMEAVVLEMDGLAAEKYAQIVQHDIYATAGEKRIDIVPRNISDPKDPRFVAAYNRLFGTEQNNRLVDHFKRDPDNPLRKLPDLPPDAAKVVRLVQNPPTANEPTLKPWPVIGKFDLVRAQEVRLHQALERVRTCQLVDVSRTYLTNAIKVTETGLPRRPPLDESKLPQRIVIDEMGWQNAYIAYKALKDELQEAEYRARKILEESQYLRDVAKGIVRGDDMSPMAFQGAAISHVGSGEDIWSDGNPYTGPMLLPHEIHDSPTSDYDPGDRPIPGGKIMQGHRQAPWMFLNTWYVIGPFAYDAGKGRPGSLNRIYGPEAGVDLDQTYSDMSKTGRTLRWRFRQTEFMRIEPYPDQVTKNAIWYFFTQVQSERDQWLWVAFGSDDYSICWVNDLEKPVYNADTIPHHWEPFVTKDMRPVHFKKGVNNILFKLENAGGTTGFSMIINTDPSLPGLDNPWANQQSSRAADQ